MVGFISLVSTAASFTGGGYSERKSIGRDEFRIHHYAGVVTYNVSGFLDKNNDLLFRDFKEAMSASLNSIVNKCYTKDELDVSAKHCMHATRADPSAVQEAACHGRYAV